LLPGDRLVGDPLELRPVVGPGQWNLPLLDHVVEQGLRIDALRVVGHGRVVRWPRLLGFRMRAVDRVAQVRRGRGGGSGGRGRASRVGVGARAGVTSAAEHEERDHAERDQQRAANGDPRTAPRVAPVPAANLGEQQLPQGRVAVRGGAALSVVVIGPVVPTLGRLVGHHQAHFPVKAAPNRRRAVTVSQVADAIMHLCE
jgi:hypothetical protein